MGGDISKGMRWLKRRSNKVAPFVPVTTADASTEYSPKGFPNHDNQQVDDDTKRMHSSTDSLLSMLLSTDPENWDESLANSSSFMSSTNRSQRRRREPCSSLYDSGFNSSSTSTAFDASAFEYHIPSPVPNEEYDIYDFSITPPPLTRPKASHGVRQGPRIVPPPPPQPRRRREPSPPQRMAPMRVHINRRISLAEILRRDIAAEKLRKQNK